MPSLLEALRKLAPMLAALAPESLFVATLIRFALAFLILAVPCSLIGATFPLLCRVVVSSQNNIGRNIGILYSWNTLGSAIGCVATGCWLVERLGLRQTNLWLAAINLMVGCVALAWRRTAPADLKRHVDATGETGNAGARIYPALISDRSLLAIAFLNGLAGIVCEVVWFRYLDFLLFLGHPAYVFPAILCIYLIGLGIGGFLFQRCARRRSPSVGMLSVVELLLAVAVLASFATGALIFSSGPPPRLGIIGMALVTVLPPTVLMGFAYPLVCSLYNTKPKELGSRTGIFVAMNTAGTVLGSLLPVFVSIPLLGIQGSLLTACGVFSAIGVSLLFSQSLEERRPVPFAVGCFVSVILLVLFVPRQICRQVFLGMGFTLAGHTDILFYREGRTGTAIVARDRLNQQKVLYVNGNPEAPTLYADQLCFKLLGDLGPLLHSNPSDVLMVCFGGGIAAGAVECLPDVHALTVVDLESSVIDAAHVLSEENNAVLQNPKTHIVIDDGRNYIVNSRRKWPVIITDSTHPKAPDSWVLYSREFYRQVEARLTDDGVFVQWAPFHDLSVDEYKIILRTFQSVFPHTSLWVADGMNERGQFITYTLLVATPHSLSIDPFRLQARLDAPSVSRDLQPYGMGTADGMLEAFLCGEDRLRQWVGAGPVNTDDLPLTYYITKYARGSRMGNGALAQLSERVAPYLLSAGPEGWRAELMSKLELRDRAKHAALSGALAEAYSLLPDDPRYRRMAELYNHASDYVDALADLYKNNINGLLYAARLGVPGPKAYQSSQRIYERVLKIDPNNVDALNMLGCIYSSTGALAEAQSCFERAIERDPNFGNVQYNFGNLLFRQGRAEDASRHYREALRIDPGDVEARINLGTLLLQSGTLDGAVACYRRAIELRPDSFDAFYNLALALKQKGETTEAIACYQKAVDINSDDVGILNEFAWELATCRELASRDGPRALKLAEKANLLSGGSIPPVLRTLAAAYAATGAFGEAEQNIQKAIRLARLEGNVDLLAELDGDLVFYQSRRTL
jgi:spermidine synthase